MRKIIISEKQDIPQHSYTEEPLNETEQKKRSSGRYILLLLLILVIVVFAMKEWLGKMSFQAFYFTDSLLKFSKSFPPSLAWGILGLLVGAVYGSITAWKKYYLKFAVNLLPLGILLLCIILFVLINKPGDAQADMLVHRSQTMYAYNLSKLQSDDEQFDRNMVYKTEYLVDYNRSTAWITDMAKASSNKELSFTFNAISNYENSNLQCVGFRIKNGYDKSPQLWKNFARAKDFLITCNGSFIATAMANDNSDYQEISIKPVLLHTNDVVSFKISSVYPGKKYNDRVAITEFIPVIQYDKSF